MNTTTPNHRPEVYTALRTLRRKLAEQQEVKPYRIFSNRTLQEIATYVPKTEAQFLRIHGVSEKKLNTYGPAFLELICDAAKKLHLDSLAVPDKTERQMQSVADPDSTYGKTLALVKEYVPLEEIARSRNMKEGTIISHIELLRKINPSLDIAYLKPDQKLMNAIVPVFETCGNEKLKTVYNALNGKYSFEILRRVRLFLPTVPIR